MDGLENVGNIAFALAVWVFSDYQRQRNESNGINAQEVPLHRQTLDNVFSLGGVL